MAMTREGHGQGVDQVEGELVYKIIGAAMSVLNSVGHGYREKTYERALCVELRHLGLTCASQHRYPVLYRGEIIDEFVPDLEVERRVIVESKIAERIVDDHIGQVLNYLKVTGMEVGLILNFAHPTLEFKKVVRQPNR
jgi:GxxExxY protein